MHRLTWAALGLGLLVAGGASTYVLRASGAPNATPGCPAREDLQNPGIDFVQAPDYYVTVTLTNPNACYGFLDEPVELTLYGLEGRRAISYFGGQAPHGDVGVCCNVTLPPHGTWTIRLGAKGQNPEGRNQYTICNIHVAAMKSKGYDVWKRMPEGGAITGHGSYPPRSVFDPNKYPPLPDEPSWRGTCDSPPPTPVP